MDCHYQWSIRDGSLAKNFSFPIGRFAIHIHHILNVRQPQATAAEILSVSPRSLRNLKNRCIEMGKKWNVFNPPIMGKYFEYDETKLSLVFEHKFLFLPSYSYISLHFLFPLYLIVKKIVTLLQTVNVEKVHQFLIYSTGD